MERRLRIKLQLSRLDRLLDIPGKSFIILLWILAVIAFYKMPDTIPTHFNASGQVDGYGNKGTIFILPVIASLIFIGLTILNKSPHTFNYLTEITEANASYQYSIATRMIRFFKVLIAMLFTIIVAITFLTSIHIFNGTTSGFLPLVIVVFLIPALYSIAVSVKRK